MYRKPELVLVGAAEGLVLGSTNSPALFKDNPAVPALSRNIE